MSDGLRVTWGAPAPGRDAATAATFCTVAVTKLDDLDALDSGDATALLDSLDELDEPTVDGPLELGDAPPPVIAERYERRHPLGSGGMGEVWRVFDRQLRRTVALKMVRSQLVGERMLARFREEAQVSAQLQHPGIIPVHDYGQLPDGRVWFTMKEVRGRTLEELLTDVHRAWRLGRDAGESGFTFRRLLESFLRVVETMAYSHSRGVVHRDLKPSNIMLGGYGEVLVLDWGLAKVTGEGSADLPAVDLEELDAESTRVGAITGTPAYMAPEQARGDSATAGPAADVYALGATLYDLLCERPPRLAASPRKLVLQVAMGRPFPPPRQIAEGPPVDEELERICLKALETEVADRYPDAAAMARDLAQWLDDARKREEAMAFVDASRAKMREAEEAEARAKAKTKQAAAFLAEVAPNAPVAEKLAGWALEDEAAALQERGRAARTEGVQDLRAALSHFPDLIEAHDALSDHLHRTHRRLEGAGRHAEARQVAADLRLHDRSGRYAAYLAGTGALTLHTDVPAEARLHRFVAQERRLEPVFERSLGTTPLEGVPLEMGSYLITLHAEGHEVVRYPVFIERQEHWDGVPPGASAPLPIRVPKLGEVPDDMVYVPAGWFWWGDDGSIPGLPAFERRWCDAFAISRFPVTVGAYAAWLNGLLDAGEVEEAERRQPKLMDADDMPVLARDADGRFGTMRNDKPGWEAVPTEAEAPAILVRVEDAAAYAAHRGAHVPTPDQWVHAARGADRRLYPWGDAFDPTWCRMRQTDPYLRVVPVGTHPEDVSPYEVGDMAGNVMDWALVGESLERRGGAVGLGPGGCRVGFSSSESRPEIRYPVTAFRIVIFF